MKTDKTKSEKHKKKLTFMEAKEEMKRKVGNLLVCCRIWLLEGGYGYGYDYVSFFLYIKN